MEEFNVKAVKSNRRIRNLEEIPQMLVLLQSQSLEEQLEAVSFFRKILSVGESVSVPISVREALIGITLVDKNPPVNIVVNAGVVPFLIQFLGFHNHPSLQFEAAW
jgi:hypothetical protein